MDKKQEINILASRLAKHYGSGEDIGACACACAGLDCGNPDCITWWQQFLTLFKAEDIAKMVNAYIIISGYPQNSYGERFRYRSRHRLADKGLHG